MSDQVFNVLVEDKAVSAQLVESLLGRVEKSVFEVRAIALNSFSCRGWPCLRLSLLGLAVGFSSYFVVHFAARHGAGDVKLMGPLAHSSACSIGLGSSSAPNSLAEQRAWADCRARQAEKDGIEDRFHSHRNENWAVAHLANEELDVRSPKSVGLRTVL